MQRTVIVLYLYLCGVLELLLQQLAHLAKLRCGLPAGLQLARPRHAVTLALLAHVPDDGLHEV